ncbi:hypothetical protein MNBD_GAMMA10-531 [hydrothermal vent metagenome]|uniref:Uncharacterized protein n=1 Tax=hydrothermal vent metagenome TaxID=652676 RepID=A0A3B0YAP3_9ZZZZ
MKSYPGIAIAIASVLLSTSGAAVANKSVSNIFVSNKGDNSMSLVKCKTKHAHRGHKAPSIKCKEVQNEVVGFNTSWPANQYKGNKHWWWTGLSGEIVGLHARRSVTPLLDPSNQVRVNTYTYDGVPAGLPQRGANFVGVTPKGKTVWNAAREIDEIQEIDTDPRSATFGQILTHIKVPLSADASPGSDTKGRMRPCDMSITPDGRYLWEPDLGGETVTGVDIKTRKVIAQITIPKVNPENRVIPFMLTTNSHYAVIENFEAPFGTVDVLDVSDPKNPKHLKKITQADGLGVNPQTGEFSKDGRYHYIINLGSPEVPGNVDVLDMNTLQIVNKIALPVDCKPHDGDHTNDGKFFVVNCSGGDSIAIISNFSKALVKEVALSGTTPRGVIVR